MGDRLLAVRLFGAFAWPPLPNGGDPQNLRRGAVELFFVRRRPFDTKNRFDACLRWMPIEAFTREKGDEGALDWVPSTEPGPGTAGHENVYRLNEAELLTRVGDGSLPFFGISSRQSASGIKLKFRGGDVFEQFETPERAGDEDARAHRLSVRVPLLRHGHDGSLITGLEVGQPGNPEFRVNLEHAAA